MTAVVTEVVPYAELSNALSGLALLVMLSMLLERALALLFEYHWFKKLTEKHRGIKTPITLLTAWFVCNKVNFDILDRIFGANADVTNTGVFITATVVAGGSSAAIALFQGVFSFDRESRTKLLEANKAKQDADLAEANLRREKAEAEFLEAKLRKEKAEREIQSITAPTVVTQ